MEEGTDLQVGIKIRKITENFEEKTIPYKIDICLTSLINSLMLTIIVSHLEERGKRFLCTKFNFRYSDKGRTTSMKNSYYCRMSQNKK